MSHLNGLERDYAARGLSVLGLTSEARDRTDAWVEAREIAFAYGFESGDVARSLGVRSFPVAFLVAPDGRIVWEGHPRGVDAKLLDQHLEGALEKPLYEWEGDAVAIREAYLAGRYADALRAAVELAREDPLGEEAQRRVAREDDEVELVLPRAVAPDEVGQLVVARPDAEGALAGVRRDGGALKRGPAAHELERHRRPLGELRGGEAVAADFSRRTSRAAWSGGHASSRRRRAARCPRAAAAGVQARRHAYETKLSSKSSASCYIELVLGFEPLHLLASLC